MNDEVMQYFKNKAKDYDLTDTQIYWKLSDKLLWNTLDNLVLKKIPEIRFFDAGGGTGRWALKILNNYSNSTGTIYDLSEEMLNEAKIKMNLNKFSHRIKIINGDLHNISVEEKFNLSYNFHNVLGFVNNPDKVLSEIAKVTEKEGYIVSFVPNLHHNIFFNILMGRLDEAEHTINNRKGRFTEDMPYMNMFTSESMTELYNKNGIEIINIKGFPITIYPGMQETQISGSTRSVLETLGANNNFDRIYNIEEKLIANPENTSSRGNNLLVIGKKL